MLTTRAVIIAVFLALTDDECHEVVRTSHDRYRTPFEHDVILPQVHRATVPAAVSRCTDR